MASPIFRGVAGGCPLTSVEGAVEGLSSELRAAVMPKPPERQHQAWLGMGGFGCCFNGIPALITLSGDTLKKKKKKDSKQHTFFIYIKSSNFLTTQVYF